MTSKYVVQNIAEFVVGCSNSAIQSDVRELVSRHLLDSIGCAIGAMGAKVTQDIKAVVDTFGGNQMCTLIGAVRLRRIERRSTTAVLCVT